MAPFDRYFEWRKKEMNQLHEIKKQEEKMKKAEKIANRKMTRTTQKLEVDL